VLWGLGRFALTIVGVVTVVYLFAQFFVASPIPTELQVTGEIYRSEGDFPHAMHSGESAEVIVYSLDDLIADVVEQKGAAFFRETGWRETPVDFSGRRYRADFGETVLDHFLGHLGTLIKLAPQVARDLDTAITASGSYYAFVPGDRLIVVVPATRKVYFAYGG
jgi:hypothetical protein